MPRKRSPNRQYFTKDTEDAIIEYNLTNDQRIKDALYKTNGNLHILMMTHMM
jgi:hypothetical protein